MNLNSKYYFDNYGYRVGDTRCRSGKCCNLISVGCVQWDFPSTELYNKKETLEEILRKIEELLLQDNSNFPISNVGGGYELYAGVHNGENTFRTLIADDGIIITQNAETIKIGFDTSSIPQQGVTSVAMTVPTGFIVGGSPITSTGTFALNYATGYTGFTTAEQSKLAGIESGAQVNVPETDPTVPAHVKSILAGDISNWNTAFGWGDHATAGYLTSYIETDPTVPSWAKQPNKPTYGWTEITGKPTFHTVATSGNYNDLNNLPNLSLKLDVPTTEVSSGSASFPHVVLAGTGAPTAKILMSNLPNIGNTNLTLTTPRTLNTGSYDFSITNLPNKSTDATFNEFLGKNASGVIARIGYPAFKAQAESWTQAQRNEFSQILNGGFSVGTMSVNLISPPVFERENNDLYIVLRGANLNLHPTDRKIEILNATTNAVLAEVPTGQIQTYASGTELIFYYNFFSLGVGTYKLKITNGVNTYITTQNFQIVSSVTNIDLSGNVWDIVSSYTPTNSYQTNNSFFFTNDEPLLTLVDSPSPILSAKTNELFDVGENFFLELQISSVRAAGSLSVASNMSRIGIGYSNSVNQLSFSSLSYYQITVKADHSNFSKRINNLSDTSKPSPYTANVTIIKQGNVVTIMEETQISIVTLSNNSGYSLFAQFSNSLKTYSHQIQIIKAYTF